MVWTDPTVSPTGFLSVFSSYAFPISHNFGVVVAEPLYKLGDVVVTKEPVATFIAGKRKGTALVGWKWTVARVIQEPMKSGVRIGYLLQDASKLYEAIVWEERIWKKWDDLSESHKQLAKAGKEIRTR